MVLKWASISWLEGEPVNTPVCAAAAAKALLDPPESTLHPTTKFVAGEKKGVLAACPTGGFHLRPPPGTAPQKTADPPAEVPNEASEPRPALTPMTPQELEDLLNRPRNNNAGIFFRHHSWLHDRLRILTVLDAGEFPASRFHRFAGCGTAPIIFESADQPGTYKVGCNRCHDRFCLPCAQDRARLVLGNLCEQKPDGPIRFLTLTLKHSADPLREQIDRLYACFLKLRRWKFWRQAVTGGAAFCEVKVSKTDGHWHPHLHVMLQGRFLPQAQVREAWFEITGDSFVVDVRLAKGDVEVARYLTRYVTKGWSNSLLRDADKLRELMLAFVGRKMIMTFGGWSKLKLLAPPTPGTWIALGDLRSICDRAAVGDAVAISILMTLNSPFYVPPLEPIDEPPDHSP